ncbi:MAG: ATP-binding protein [Rhodopirellula sp.]|nr:ATP-binding protein [Rhodopirellula sp.]
MIIELTLENFKTFLEPTTISFAAGTTSRVSGNLLRHQNGERFVKSMAVYGRNASGKTTTLDGLYALWAFVDFSGQDQKPTSRIPRFEPFALDQSWSKRPSRVALTIELEGERFTFDVSATADRVWNETLKVQRTSKQPSRKTTAKLLIERIWNPDNENYSTTLHEDLGTELTRKAVIEQTTPNRLMLGKLASMNSDVARRITEWFDRDLEFYDMHRNPFSEDAMLEKSARLLKESKTFAEVVARFMKDADTGIQELHIVDEETVTTVFSESDKSVEFKKSTKPGISFRHATEDGSEVFFRRQRESSGTLRFVALLAAILEPSQRRRLVCIDELSASMHPDLVRRLVRVIHSSRYNKLGNQLLFTTHDTHLMDPNELLRRDQITLCNKDRFGRSTTKRLDEFQDAARSDANLQKQYLQGRFGGIPQFGPTLEDVPVDDEPMEVAP